MRMISYAIIHMLSAYCNQVVTQHIMDIISVCRTLSFRLYLNCYTPVAQEFKIQRQKEITRSSHVKRYPGGLERFWKDKNSDEEVKKIYEISPKNLAHEVQQIKHRWKRLLL